MSDLRETTLNQLKEALIQVRRDLHKIPELGFQEWQTQAYLLHYLSRLPQERIEVKKWETGLFVLVKGTNPRKRYAYRTDIDGLPIEEETGFPFRSTHPNRMHACGHDLHMTIALGLLTYFVHHPLTDDLLFLFQPAEEGPGGAYPMRESEEMKKWWPDEIVALHIAPEYPVGTIATRPGILFANTSELFITLNGLGGHAAYPHHTKDMIVAASQLVTALQTIVSRSMNPLDSAVVTIGKLEAGTRQNIIAEKARLEGTIRTLSQTSMEKVRNRIIQLVKGIEVAFECKGEIDFGSSYTQVFNHSPLTETFMAWADELGDVDVVEANVAMTGEDFGYFLEKIPGFMFWLGVDSPYGLHHSRLNPNEEAIQVAVRLLIRYFQWKTSSR
ncbi:N-acetyl-diaminopimelate deacetylase [[Clostridium] ultunense Esp]|nr:N-acetyl-diaminopimelate deacetylase [[Clostridium] ultunense Esp]